MLSLADIDAKFPETHDGSLYSDLYKAVHGVRPRYARFSSIEEFDADYKFLCGQLEAQNEREARQQAACWDLFVERIAGVQELVTGCTRERAIEILAESEDELDDLRWYGYECIEWSWNLPYGSIKKWLDQ